MYRALFNTILFLLNKNDCCYFIPVGQEYDCNVKFYLPRSFHSILKLEQLRHPKRDVSEIARQIGADRACDIKDVLFRLICIVYRLIIVYYRLLEADTPSMWAFSWLCYVLRQFTFLLLSICLEMS